MTDHELMSRREFIGRASRTVAGAGLVAGGVLTAEAALAQTTLDKSAVTLRRLGRTDLMISHVVAAWDWNEWVYPEAVRLGINYWHKIAGWPKIPEPLQKLPREAWYCDIAIDTFDEQGAIDQFEWARKALGLDYIDSMKLHSIYQTPEDVKQKTGIFRAFDTLKKQKKVRFLASAQHGNNTMAICAAMIESGNFDHLQPALSILTTPEQTQMLELARKHDVGIIGKKVMGILGRVSREPQVRQRIQAQIGPEGKLGAAVIKTMLSQPGVTAVVPMTRSIQQLTDNLTNGGLGLAAHEKRAVEMLRAAGAGTCSYCGTCLGSCPKQVAISDILRYATYDEVYGEPRRAASLYRQLPADQRADQCARCGTCEGTCPLAVPVRRRLQEAHARLA